MSDPQALTAPTSAPTNAPTTGTPPAPADASGLPARLGELRAEIDRVDEALHDLLMRRAEIVGGVAELTRIGKIPFRPGREAAIIRRLLARHAGRLPPRAIVRLWREVFAANIALESRFLIAVCEPAAGDQMVQLAREHFGALTPVRVGRSPAQAISEVSAGQATAAVLPPPAQDEPGGAAWWTGLLHRDAPRIHVVARLPFWRAPRPEGAATAEALVVAAAAADPSGADRSLIGFDLPAEGSRTRIAGVLAEVGLATASLLLRRDPAGGSAYGLIDVEGYVTDDDPRLRAVAGAVVLGRYAEPVEGHDA